MVACILTWFFQDIHSKLECKDGVATCLASFGLGRERGHFSDVTAYYWSYLTYPIAAVSWLVVSTVELILFILVLKKASYNISHKRRAEPTLGGRSPDVMATIARDSIIYFAVCAVVFVWIKISVTYSSLCISIFTLGLIATILSFIAEINLPETSTAYVRVILYTPQSID